MGFAVVAAAGVWFHYTAALPLAAQAVWALRGVAGAAPRRCSRPTPERCCSTLPWLPYLGERTPVELAAAFNPRSTGDRIDTFLRALVGHPYKEPSGTCPASRWRCWPRRRWWRPSSQRPGPGPCARRRCGARCGRSSLTAVAAPLWVVAYTAFDANVFSPRYLVVSVPAATILLAGLVGGRPASVAVPATLVLVVVIGTTSIRTAFGDLRRPAYDEAAALIDREAGPADPVIELPFAPVEGAWRRALTAFLDEPHALYGADRPGAEGGWRAAERRGVAYVLYPDTLLLGPPRPPRGSDLVPVERRVWRGTSNLTLVVYRRP